MKNWIIAVLVVLCIVSLIGNGLLFERYSTSRPLVKIGSDAITKKQYQDAVDYQTQGAVLRKMVFASIVEQAAKKAGVTPDKKDVDARIALIERTKPEMLQAANQDPAKMASLRDDLKTDIALDNLRTQGITATPAEVAAFYQKNKRAFALPMQIQTTTVVASNAVDASTAAQLLKDNTPLDVIARQPRLLVAGVKGFNPNFSGLPPAVTKQLSATVQSMKTGQVKVVPVGKQFLIFRANKNLSAGIPPLSQIKDQVAEYVKLQKAPPANVEMAKLYKGAKPDFEVDTYSKYFADIQTAADDASSADKKTASAK